MQFSRSIIYISFIFASWVSHGEEILVAPGKVIQCQVPSPTYITLKNQDEQNKDSIVIESKTSFIDKNRKTRFIGDVKLSSNGNKIQSEEILVDRLETSIESKGKTRFQNDIITIDAEDLRANNKEKLVVMSNSKYQLNSAPGKGGAKELKISEKGVVLTSSSYTSCLDEKPDWSIAATEINLSSATNTGEAWNTIFKVQDIPVFYLPYFNFPLTDERKTGLLYPEISTSTRSGFEVSLPFYWNIAENMDATITPHYMSKRGTQLNTEFRYLSDEQFGQLNIEYLNNDDEISDDDARYLARFQHAGTFADNYRVHVDFSDLSDDNYLVDLGSDQFDKNESYLWRIGELSYFGKDWHSTIKVEDFKVLGDRTESYKVLPQIEVFSYQPLGFLNSTYNFSAEYTHFDTSEKNLPTADRLHLETGINIPYSAPGWFVNSDFSLMHTIYQQDNIKNVNISSIIDLDEDVDRTLPKFRVHTGLNFDRDTNIFFENMIQTFEPQVQYLYIPETKQDDIYIYDSSALQDDFDGLFRDRRFSSVDRIAEANQISVGATTRILNKENSELFHFSMGRIYYFDGSNSTFSDDGETEDSSSLAADLFVQLAKRWQLQSDIQYNTKTNNTEKSQISLDYRKDNRNVFMVSHRFIRDLSGATIEQVSALSSFPINDDWQFVGHVTQDLSNKRSLESYAGFQYESCCWAVRFTYHRDINTDLETNDFTNENRDEFDSGFMLQFVLKGLGGNQTPISIDDMLESGLFGYKRPYFLSN